MGVRILNSEPAGYSETARSILRACGDYHEEPCGRDRLLELIPDFDVAIVRLGSRIDEQVFSRADRLKVVVSATTGLDHIDLEAAAASGVVVLSLKGERAFLETITSTAELTWGLLLALVRKIPQAHFDTLSGRWDRSSFIGDELRDRTLGVFGFGRLGRIVASYGQAFRMRTIACDRVEPSAVPPYVTVVSEEEVLAEADVLTLHVDLNDSTRGLFGRRRLGLMKQGALLVNTSRGEVIEEAQLVEALKSGHLGGAALDVLCGEAGATSDWLQRNPLWSYAQDYGNLILSPHIGGASNRAMEETEVFMAQKLHAFLKQKEAARQMGRYPSGE